MGHRFRIIGLGLGILLAGCGESASPNGQDPGAKGLRPILDKPLHLTHASVIDSNGAVVHVFCGDDANPCQSDEVVFTAAGEHIIRECDDCPLADPRNERADWTLDEARNEITISDDGPSPDLTYGIAAVSGESITLDIPTEEFMSALFWEADADGSRSATESTAGKGTTTRLIWAGE